ncbi:hypothetical protein ACOMHN_003771 [Nucella lapillus]
MLTKQTRRTPKWAGYVLFFLLTSLTSEGATLPSGISLTSASASVTPNQRATRSADDLDPRDMEEEADVEDFSEDFVEKFFDVLEGPVGKEAEALLASVLKLLSENDRVNLLSSAGSDWRNEQTLPLLAKLHASKRHFQLPNPNPDSLKRRLPKFNPTGWRRKRAIYSNMYNLQRFLRRVLTTKLPVSKPREAIFPNLPEDDVGPKITEWKNKKRESLRRVLQRLPKELEPKRRPLEFNPTGW